MISERNFKSETSKSFATGRTNELKALDKAIGNYHRDPNTAASLADKLFDWAKLKGLKPDGSINTGRNKRVVAQLVSDVEQLVPTLKARIVKLPRGGAAGGTPSGWVVQNKAALDRCKDMACGDATTFDSCINKKKKDRILELGRTARIQGGMAAAMIGRNSKQWDENAGSIKASYNNVVKNEAGVCTTFAHYCAHVLAQGHQDGRPRIEIVAFKNHVFVIVGRAGGYEENHKLPNLAGWGSNWCIVDGWAGAMGYEVIYKQQAGYPYKSMLSPLKLVVEK